MRVVSQDRCESFDFDRTMFWRQDGVIYAHIVGDTRDRVVGNYKSEERAAEVFEDIHNAYGPYGLICDNITDEQIQAFVGSKNIRMPVIKIDNMDCNVTTYDSIIYYMPEV